MKTLSVLVAATAVFAMTAYDASAQSRGRVRAQGPNSAVAAGYGPNGGTYVRGGGVQHNADGSVTARSGGAARGPNGGAAVRGSTTTLNPDGSASRQSGAAARGPNGGTVASTGSATRNADGTYSGQRSTEATGPNGNSYSGSTSYDPVTGVTRSTTCTNSAGAVVPCRP